MPAPAPIAPLAVGWSPRLIPVDAETEGGRGGGGLQPNPIRGVSIAFGSRPGDEAPLWQNIEEVGGP